MNASRDGDSISSLRSSLFKACLLWGETSSIQHTPSKLCSGRSTTCCCVSQTPAVGGVPWGPSFPIQWLGCKCVSISRSSEFVTEELQAAVGAGWVRGCCKLESSGSPWMLYTHQNAFKDCNPCLYCRVQIDATLRSQKCNYSLLTILP